MILKASQRGGGSNLAAHLMNDRDNDHVRLHEIRGFMSDDLRGAFKEAEAISLGTKCRQYLFSLSLSPPESARVPVSVFENAIERIEERLGLEGQPRAVVFHEKEARLHAHCVWSRIDAETMTAKQLSHFKMKLRDISRELYLEQGWHLPRGLENPSERNPTNFSLAEWQQAKRQGIDPRWLKSTLQACWNRSDTGAAFARSVEDKGFFLARGDRRGFVVLDHTGEVWSLARMLDVKSKDVRARLGDGQSLPSVAQTQHQIGAKMTPALRRYIEQSRETFRARADQLGQYKAEMTKLHREARATLEERQKRDWEDQTRQRAARLPKGVRGLWWRITGQYQQTRRLNEQEAELSAKAQAQERQSLVETQRDQRRVLQERFKELRQTQARQLLDLRADMGRYIRMTRQQEAGLKADIATQATTSSAQAQSATHTPSTPATSRERGAPSAPDPGLEDGLGLGLSL